MHCGGLFGLRTEEVLVNAYVGRGTVRILSSDKHFV
jgi:hypothetical protein